MKPKILIITGYGVNCEAESSRAWKLAGGEPVQVHLNDLLDNPAQMRECGTYPLKFGEFDEAM
jgi:phosphoribosylformylglycinamidine synthase